MNSITGLSPQQLRKAADLKERIEALQSALNAILGGGNLSAAAGATAAGKRNISAAGRARISAAAKARWEQYRHDHPAAPAKAGKRKFSAEGRARLAALARERWAKAKQAGKTRL